MADGGPPVPEPPPLALAPPAAPPASPTQPPASPTQPVAPPIQPASPLVQPCPMPQLNWSHFKPEFAGKPNEDVEAHLLRINDWINTQAFPEDTKVQRFCLTLVGEARLWYESLKPIVLDWNGLETQFRQQYSNIGNTREQLFHAWRSFHFNENPERLDSYVTCIMQVALLLGYDKPKVLEVCKNTLPSRLYWVPIPIEDLIQAVKTTKRILTKEKIDNQLMGQSSSTPFMNIGDGYNSSKKVVTFETQDRLDDKLDKITSMMSKLTAQGSNQNRPFKPKIYQGKRTGQAKIIIIKIDIKIGIDQTVAIEKCHIEVELSMDKSLEEGCSVIRIIEVILGKAILEGMQNYWGQNFRGGYRGNFRNDNFGRGRSRSRER